MEKTYLMMKDTPVLEIDNYVCRVLDYLHLPISLRYENVSFDDVMHGWTENRTMNIGKTNAKKILAGFGIRQSNPYMIAKMFHFASLNDCYWMKEDHESINWKDVSLFRNDLSIAVSKTALLGSVPQFPKMSMKLHTPELTTQGMAAKAWIRTNDGLYLYKVGRREIAASEILDTLGISHVEYSIAKAEELLSISDEERQKAISEANEQIVKSKIISSEDIALVPWEDYQMYCDYHDENEFDYLKNNCRTEYYSMQIADYILNNDDRHGANFGFFMDNENGKLMGMYPLMDHDHAFASENDIPSQTSEYQETLKEAALNAMKYADIDFKKLLSREMPDSITPKEWESVLKRTRVLELYKRISKETNISNINLTEDALECTLKNGMQCHVDLNTNETALSKNGIASDSAIALTILDEASMKDFDMINKICSNSTRTISKNQEHFQDYR